MIYWDTSVILKLYVEEIDSANWQAIAVSQNEPLRSSTLALAEMAHALRQREIQKFIPKRSAATVFSHFEADVKAGRFVLAPLGRDVLDLSVKFALNDGSLRTLDGLHLASSRLLKCTRMATSDKRLAQVAEAAGFELVGTSRP